MNKTYEVEEVYCYHGEHITLKENDKIVYAKHIEPDPEDTRMDSRLLLWILRQVEEEECQNN